MEEQNEWYVIEMYKVKITRDREWEKKGIIFCEVSKIVAPMADFIQW